MESYFLLKLIHVLSATLLFGTGLGTAFFFWMAHRRGDVRAIAITARHVVLADTLFTAPAIIVQPLTGWWLMQRMGMGFDQSWLQATIVLYLLAGACWLPVVWIQLRLRNLAEAAVHDGTPLPQSYQRLAGIWFALGWPAFLAVIGIFWLMVRKPVLW
jgi:uncharacterized membrane protein